jgi:hypothetical protein
MAIPDTTIITLKTWLEQAQTWLREDGSSDALQPPHRQLLGMMSQAREENRASRVWDLINEMEKLALHMTDTREQGEVFVRCAKMAADLENLKDALRLLQAAESKYKAYPHQRAVTLWMIGCIHWLSRQKVEGISNWQDAISLFKERKLNVQVDSDKAKWYVAKLPEFEKYLETAITNEGLPPYNLDPIAASAPSQGTVSHPPDSLEEDSLRWLSCRISESVPAGGFGPIGYDPEPLGFLEISEVLIENEPYLVHSIRRMSTRRNAVNISSQSQYITVHVNGTSMNAARPVPIDDGDYILVQSQNNADDNEIVVAGIFGQDKRATVKRMKCNNGKIRLIPESYDPSHYELDWEKEFNELDGQFQIIGVVEAVFKKKH